MTRVLNPGAPSLKAALFDDVALVRGHVAAEVARRLPGGGLLRHRFRDARPRAAVRDTKGPDRCTFPRSVPCLPHRRCARADTELARRIRTSMRS
ncbi:hypothetical protein GCM10010171_22010 [Actinokineospora fastidiosa]|uniref:Uncharacterized protein n=1 Tax=Actinokineospora fastidiosa TaxID=1816 RepID=A0A918GBD7_9PSEU|nr:hypothetical protein GCM10010171_22010 [Actinokineospora fastidiosa]